MQRIKDFFTGRDSEIRIGFLIAASFFMYLTWYAIDRSSHTQEERTALLADRVVEIHPPGNPTVVCFVLNNYGHNDSISCLKK